MSISLKHAVGIALIALAVAYMALVPLTARSDNDTPEEPSPALVATHEPTGKVITAMITGYNTVEAQTDSTPCNAAGGNICGRRDTVACPRSIALHTWIEIDGNRYECMDRTAPKFNNRFDISCDKDMSCPARLTGRKHVFILE
jgi:hypothetical protein